MHLLQLEKVAALIHFPGLQRKGPGMAARQEVRLKEAEAADKEARLTETRSLNQPAALSALMR